MGIGLNEVVKACKELGWKGCQSENAVKNNVINIILGGVLTDEQLKKIIENTWSNHVRTAARLKLAGASKHDIVRNLVLRGRRRRERTCRAVKGVCNAIRSVFGEKYELLERLICPYCGKQFRLQSRLSSHIRRYHYDELMNDVEKVVELIKQRRR